MITPEMLTVPIFFLATHTDLSHYNGSAAHICINMQCIILLRMCVNYSVTGAIFMLIQSSQKSTARNLLHKCISWVRSQQH